MLGTIIAALLILTPGTAQEQDFAEFLYESGEFQMAATEYLRIIHANGGDTLSDPASSLRLARCWQELGRSGDAILLYRRLRSGLPEGDSRAMAFLGEASILEEFGDFPHSRELCLEAVETATEPSMRDRSRIMASLMLARQGRWSESSQELTVLASTEGPWSERALILSELVASGEQLPERSPFWCGLSSALIPGSGQVFSGHYVDGLIAFGMNGLMGYLFYEAVSEGDTATSVLLGWLGLSFYGGNIYGGARAAETFNSARRRELFEEISGELH